MTYQPLSIFVETAKGDVIRAFTWVGSKDAGVARAAYEAMVAGWQPKRVWAAPR